MTVWVLLIWIAGTVPADDQPPVFLQVFEDEKRCELMGEQLAQRQPGALWSCLQRSTDD